VLRSNFLALLPEYLDGLFKITFGFLECFFAIHHARAGLLPELVDICSCDAHDSVV
jgi:hypothetical protein